MKRIWLVVVLAAGELHLDPSQPDPSRVAPEHPHDEMRRLDLQERHPGLVSLLSEVEGEPRMLVHDLDADVAGAERDMRVAPRVLLQDLHAHVAGVERVPRVLLQDLHRAEKVPRILLRNLEIPIARVEAAPIELFQDVRRDFSGVEMEVTPPTSILLQDLQDPLVGAADENPPSCLVGPNSPITSVSIEDMLLVLAVLAVFGGILATCVDMLYDPLDMGCWYRLMERSIGYDRYNVFVLTLSVVSATLLDWTDLITDILVVGSYAACGAWVWFGIGLTILVGSTVFIAHNATLVAEDSAKVPRFLMAVFQLDLLVEGVNSIRDGRKSIHFARSKFLEGLLESCPQAFLSMYVLYQMHAESHFWLVASTIVSICSLAYGLSEWLEIGVDESVFLHTFWYHHLSRTCYFAVDFSLRLLTVALMLHEPSLEPIAPMVFASVILVYVVTASAYTTDLSDLAKTLLLTFFINILPAELRKREGRERFLYLLDPDLRVQLHNPILLVRITEFICLSGMIVYMASEGHPRRSMTLGALLTADMILVWCVRLTTDRLEVQHNELRRASSLENEASPQKKLAV